MSREAFHLTYDDNRMSKSTASRKGFLLGSAIAGIAGIGIGILIGYFGICDTEKLSESRDGVFLEGVSEAIIQEGDPTVTDKLFEEINPDNIRKYLRELSKTPRLAGTPADYKTAKYIYDFWTDQGANDVTIVPYDILLSYPNASDPSKVYLLYSNGSVQHETPDKEERLTEWDDSDDIVPPILGFTAAGDVTAELVYANYGREEDFAVLDDNDVGVEGKVVICRYGKGYRGNKVKTAESLGAVGVIIYSDPADWLESMNDKLYPDGVWLPPSGVQRGSAYSGDGDTLTPGYPATEFAFRYNPENLSNPLPTIPAVPIGYGDAVVLLREMTGVAAPDSFTGALNVTYRLGRNQKEPIGVKVRVTSSNFIEIRRVYNVFGMIRGYIEPDRYVVIGSHRDAWVYGAVDTAGGSAVMMEISRVMMKLVKEGVWRPKRTLIFSSWSAEEYGLIGATEWIEEYYRNLQHRTVAYLNLDCAMIGNVTLRALSSPPLYRALYEAAKKVRNPIEEEFNAGLETVYDGWLKHRPWKHHKTNETLQIPSIGKISEGSDYGPFLIFAGIPAADMRFDHQSDTLSFYSTYHSAYDTFDVIDKYYDPDYKFHTAVSKVSAEFLRIVSDSLMIPFNVSDYAWQLQVSHDTLEEGYGELMKNNSIQFDHLTNAVANFTRDAEAFRERIQNINKNDPLAVRLVNDQMVLLERAFTDPLGLPGRQFTRHIISATSSRNAYGAGSFPGLTDGMFEIENHPEKWEEVKNHFSVVIHTIRSASSTLRDVVKFIPNHVV